MTANKNQPAVTILTITIGFLIVYLLTKGTWAIYVSVIIGLLSLLSVTIAALIEKIWMKIGWVLSLIIPNIILTIIFFLILTPLALLAKVFSRKDHLFLSNPNGSVFTEKLKEMDKSSFENPW